MKKNKSIKNTFSGYKVFGIVSQLKDYKIAYLINNSLNIFLEKQLSDEDLTFFYYFSNGVDYDYFFLTPNQKTEEIFKMLKNISGILLLKPHIPTEKPDSVAAQLMQNTEIIACLKLSVEILEYLQKILEIENE